MNIPKQAIDAAYWEIGHSRCDPSGELIKEMLTAAAPFIAAQALREAAEATYNLEDGSVIDIHRSDIAEWLDARANEMEGK